MDMGNGGASGVRRHGLAMGAKDHPQAWRRLQRDISLRLSELGLFLGIGITECLGNAAGHLLKKLSSSQNTAMHVEQQAWAVEGRRALRGRTCVVTGGNAGIGEAVAAELAACGAHVIIACRSMERGEAAVRSIRKRVEGGVARVDLMQLDLNSLASVRGFSREFAMRGHALDVLVNNAGIMTPPARELTIDGFECQWQVNYLGHFLLTQQLLGARQPSSKRPTRIVNLTSMAHRGGNIHFEDIHFDMVYNPFAAYAQSKLANVLTTNELHRRFPTDDVVAVSVHPGLVNTALARSFFLQITPHPLKPLMSSLFPFILNSTEEALETVMYAITAPAHHVAGRELQ